MEKRLESQTETHDEEKEQAPRIEQGPVTADERGRCQQDFDY
ncbi:hypothetical protein ACUYOF_22645 [Photobacterium ganghwense]|nr:hypothetical protein [Photobacterium ganghwense]